MSVSVTNEENHMPDRITSRQSSRDALSQQDYKISRTVSPDGTVHEGRAVHQEDADKIAIEKAEGHEDGDD